MTDSDTSDATTAGSLVAGSGGNIRKVIADGAYDGQLVAKAIRTARPAKSPPRIVIPPPAKSIPSPGQAHGGSELERHCAEIVVDGRMARPGVEIEASGGGTMIGKCQAAEVD